MNFRLPTLLANLDQQNLVPIRRKVPKGADVIGVLPIELQQLYSRLTTLHREAEKVALAAQHSDDEEEQKSLSAELNHLVADYEILKETFWFETKDHFDTLCHDHMGIAEGWQVWAANMPLLAVTNIAGLLFGQNSEEQLGKNPGPGANDEEREKATV